MVSHLIKSLLSATALVCLLFTPETPAYFGSVQKAAARAAAAAARKQAAQRPAAQAAKSATRRSAVRSADRVVKRWTSSLCKPAKPCPLDEKTANTFRGGSYNETILGADTLLYRHYQQADRKFGAPGERFSYWSRTRASGTQAIIDRAIPVSRYGNRAEYVVTIRVPKGTRIYEGVARGLDKGAVGGGNQIVLERVRPHWQISD